MTEREYPRRRKAAEMLMAVTVLWGVSFPVMRAIWLAQEKLLPGLDSWFSTSATVAIRFAGASLVMLCLSWRTLRQLTRLEVWEGIGLGFFSGGGILLQMDGLARTSASTSAFLTQSYCVILPVIVALRNRRRPSWIVLICALMVMAGVGVLARVDLRSLRIGRGELETLIASGFFAGQILWLDRPAFAGNRVNHFTLVMFLATVVLALPICAVSTSNPGDWLIAFGSPVVAGLMAILILLCTMVCILVMNRWQPDLPVAEAGLIYAMEPVSASLLALFLPGWFSSWGGFSYPNERATINLLIGGGLITGANILIQFLPARRTGA